MAPLRSLAVPRRRRAASARGADLWQDRWVIVERILEFVRRPEAGRFEELALAAFAYQFEQVAPYRAMCERDGRTPATVRSWRDIPAVPAAAFATVELATDPPVELFRSSGTLGDARSVHRHPFPGLYRVIVEASFPAFCLPRGTRPEALPPILSLVPPRAVAPDSSLAFMIEHVLDHFGGPDSTHAIGERGVEVGRARSWLSARQREHRPALIVATTLALADLLDFLHRMDLKLRLAPGSAVFETGGAKGRDREVDRGELETRLATHLALGPGAIVAEYGMTELTSQAYTRTLAGGDPGLYLPPPWMRVRALDPESLAELPDGESGLLAFLDLGNVGSALHVLTEDLGRTDAGGFRLDGRAPEAALRGCSLLAEELAGRR